jgi:FixJ family two-component response regulator
LAALLADSAWKLIAVDTCKKAVSNIQNARRPVVLLDENLDNQPWQESLRLLLLAHQRACVVLLANPSDGHLFREVTHHGAFDLLMRPIEKGQVFQCLFFAYSRWVTVQPAGSLRPARPVRAREAELAHQ